MEWEKGGKSRSGRKEEDEGEDEEEEEEEEEEGWRQKLEWKKGRRTEGEVGLEERREKRENECTALHLLRQSNSTYQCKRQGRPPT